MNVALRPQRAAEDDALRALIAAAFAGKAYSDGTEADLPATLRAAGALTLSTVAEAEDGALAGQACLSPATVGGTAGWLALGPVAVAPVRQGEGIGGALVAHAVEHARSKHARGVVLIGDPGYYGRFGFTSHADLTWRGLPSANVMALPLDDVPARGEIAFHPAFG